MDELHGVTSEPAARRELGTSDLPPVEVDRAAAAPVPLETDSGSLAEVEALQGALFAGDPDAEVDGLRRSLEVEDRPETMTPTNYEQAREAEILRSEVTSSPPGAPDGVVDPTERYEIHDAAVSGDAIARAIDEAGADERALDQELSDEAARVELDRDERAFDRYGRAQADAEGAAAARAMMSDAADAASVVSDRQRDARREGDRSAEALREREAAGRRSEDARHAEVRASSDKTRARRQDDERSRTELLDDEVVRDRTSMLAEDRTTQMSGSAAAAHFGSGRPPARIEDRGTDRDERDERADRIAEVFDVDGPRLRTSREDAERRG